MAHATSQGPKLLHGFKRPTRFEKGLGAELPEAYKKFWREWKLTKPAAVHYIPKEGEWERDDITGEIKPIQDQALPLIDVPEANEGIWGGEAIVKGFQKRNPHKRRVPHFWVPVLKRSVVHSQVLDQYISTVVTERTLNLIHECQGFDHYLLKNPACDLRSTLAFKLKRKILVALLNGCPDLSGNPAEQKRILNEYKKYLEAYTPEEIDWYGLTYQEALRKLQAQIRAENPIVPHKVEFRLKLIEQLKNAGIKEAGGVEEGKGDETEALQLDSPSTNWLSKINPFGKKQET
ncbi:39S ribosomal protein L28, mitochondrial [Episyrphus balteatus]|uniref:39S ribosomal protein L28, mitochondrial n=1 Tax=Episyrphus balteatus TaxID=286459 RepID=UPI002486BA5B|nr:39S ribosomal protein L28, mitochondrial [Episyrphus balteatus]